MLPQSLGQALFPEFLACRIGSLCHPIAVHEKHIAGRECGLGEAAFPDVEQLHHGGSSGSVWTDPPPAICVAGQRARNPCKI